ncbi:VCBS domain-containing protein, partial [Bradyrhizobium sp. UFLA05-153]
MYTTTAAGDLGTSDTSLLGAKIWINSDGTVGYDASSISAQLQAKATGETLIDKFTYAIRLGNGTLSWATVTLNFAGVNDAPTMIAGSTTATGSFSELAATTGSSTSDGANGSIAFADVDLSDTHTVSQTAPSFAWSGGTLSAGQISALTSASTLALTKTDSTGTGSGSVAWNYSAQDKTFDFLAAGQTLTVSYQVTVNDGHGGSVSQPVTITVTGTNDQPTIVAGSTTASGMFSEAANTTGSTATDITSGSIAFADVDLSDSHTLSQASPSFAWSGGPLSAGQISALTSASTLALTKTDSTGTGSGSVVWTYSAQDKTFDFLAAGQTLTVIYAVTVDDGHGGSTSQNVVVTVSGTNDSPTIVAGSTTATGAFNEAAGVTGLTASDITSGSIAFADVDLSDSHTLSQASPSFAWSGGPLSAGQISALTSASTLALTKTDSTGTGSGSVVWTYSAQDKTFDFLAAGQTLTVIYAVTVDDGHGGSTSQNVVVTVSGTNDSPTIVAGSTTATGAFNEAAGVTGLTASDSANGSIAFADVDLSDAHTVSQADPTFSWSGGPLSAGQISALTSASTLALTKSDSTGTGSGSVAWSFSAQDKTFDFLAAGQTLTASYVVTINDGHGGTTTQNVVVTITGTNDAPVLAADASGPHGITEAANTTG